MFLESAAGPLFTIYFAPGPSQSGRNDAVAYLPPFGEEMNRSRRMASLLARALARAGVASLLVDPHGTGDSAGTLEDATWQTWQANARDALAWLGGQGHRRLHLVGLRTGANLALAASNQASSLSSVVLWQPVIQGSLFLSQLLRVRVASGLGNSERAPSETTRGLKARLMQDEIIEVAGYPLTGAMARQIEDLDLADLARGCAVPIHWLDVVGDASADPAPATERALEAMATGGPNIKYKRIAGDQFWAIEEPALVLGLISETVSSVAESGA